MWDTEEDYEENEEILHDCDYENPECSEEEVIDVADLPPVMWVETILRIEDPEVRRTEIKVAEKLYEEEQELERKRESGDISQGAYEYELHVLRRKNTDAARRWDLATIGMTAEDLGDVAEDWNYILRTKGSLDNYRGRIKETAEDKGPESAKEVADRMHEEGRLSKDAQDIIARQVDQVRRSGK